MDGLPTRDGTYFYRSRAQVFRFGQRFYMIIVNVSSLFIVYLGRLYFVWRFGAAVCQTSKNYWWRYCPRQHVKICDSICSNGLVSYPTVLKSLYERIGHLYDIDIFVQIILSLIALPCTNYLTFNFDSPIFSENYHWLFHLDWLFEILTDTGSVQDQIWE